MALAHQHQDHIHTGTVITTDPVGRHQVASILGAADDIRPVGMNCVQMGDQQHGDLSLIHILEMRSARPVLNSWLSDLVADCNEDEVKIITDTVTALKASLHRNRSEDK